MSALDKAKAIAWFGSQIVADKIARWLNTDPADDIDPGWERHEGLLRATHPKPEGER